MLILDANILIRAALGSRVLALITGYSDKIEFAAPEVAFEEARENLPGILAKRKVQPDPAIKILDTVGKVVKVIELGSYADFETVARQRLFRRDESDWPILAAALALDCPIWTEDTDFFGCGVPTWTTDRVELYFKANLS